MSEVERYSSPDWETAISRPGLVAELRALAAMYDNLKAEVDRLRDKTTIFDSEKPRAK